MAETKDKKPAVFLPAVYEAAKTALAKCAFVGEAKETADKASALASYAAVSNDDELYRHATRIKLMATKRMGELFLAVGSQQGRRTDQLGAAAGPKLSRSDLGKQAGVSKRRQKTAIRLARVENFDELIDAVEVPTITELAALGTKKKTLVTVNTGDEQYHTPPEYIESARKVMGGIYLDPASNDLAQETVAAYIYYTADDDGLSKHWAGRVWLNPPYTKHLINRFVEKLVASDIETAILLTDSKTDTKWCRHAIEHCQAVCFTYGRINFLKPGGGKSSPTTGQMFFYFGSDPDGFKAEFSQYGWCVSV